MARGLQWPTAGRAQRLIIMLPLPTTICFMLVPRGTSTTATLNLRNNIFSNTSTPNGTGLTVAYRRSGTALNNYAAASNNNLFYAGAPGYIDNSNTQFKKQYFFEHVHSKWHGAYSGLPQVGH